MQQHRGLSLLLLLGALTLLLLLGFTAGSTPPAARARIKLLATPTSRPLTGVTQIAASYSHTCALTISGTVYCWGYNEYGQLGDGTITDRLTPITVSGLGSGVTAIVAGYDHTCAATSNGRTYCWGDNYYGQLGDGTITDRLTPVTVSGLNSGVTAIAAMDHTCAVTTYDRAYCWGYNEYGQLGDGTTADRLTPVTVSSLGSNVTAIAAGYDHTCALTISGTVYCWGDNEYGQLGDGTTTDSIIPITVSGLGSDVTALAAGYYHTCAATSNGRPYCWGDNDYGQLGDGTTTNRLTPITVSGLGSDVTAMTAGYEYSCAATTNGKTYCWGYNEYGQLGDGTTNDRLTPVTVSGLGSNVIAIAAGFEHTCAVTANDRTYCWGYNGDGELGDGTTTNRLTPVVVINPNAPAEPTSTPTATPSATATSTFTPTPRPTITPTSTPTTPPTQGDAYEPNDSCAQAGTIPTDGTVQLHTFHQTADEDWVRFDGVANQEYLIHVDVPQASPADVALQLKGACNGIVEQTQDNSFSAGIQLAFTAPTTGPIHLQLTNHEAAVAGADVTYTLSVRALDAAGQPGALILVAGKISDNDKVQPNIYHVTDMVYQLFQENGYTDDHIYYLAPDIGRPNVDAAASIENLRLAITEWAAARVGPNRALTLYLMDHGSPDLLYLDKQRRQWVTPAQLDEWLSTLEAQQSDLVVNVIVEACYSGSFISGPESVSKAGRVVITSTSDRNLAWATAKGAGFSDHFVQALRQGKSLYSSYVVARDAAAAASSLQLAWLDGNGDGYTRADDARSEAARRGFGFPGTLPNEVWAPYIKTVDIGEIAKGRGRLRVQILDDVAVDHAWAVIYGPDYVAPDTGEALIQETLPTVTLLSEGNHWYSAYYDGFTTVGSYRIVFQAEDNEDLAALPVVRTVANGSRLFLPLVLQSE